jgi:ATP-dependent helicase YprA (DUF1998 family)
MCPAALRSASPHLLSRAWPLRWLRKRNCVTDAPRLFRTLRDYYFRYYDTPFSLADKRLQQERRELLDRDGVTWRELWLEPLRSYRPAGRTVEESCRAANATEDLAFFARAGLLPPERFEQLFAHQEHALLEAMGGRDVVITAGTGSGKTEAFLLPVLAYLLQESAGWGSGQGQPGPEWWRDGTNYVPQRVNERGRHAAVRALVLYPMNALVEDQLVRLRQALDGSAARAWLDEHRPGHRFYFGRYTGRTPVSGLREGRRARQNLQQYLATIERRSLKAEEDDLAAGEERKRFFVPRLDGAEMRSRWDIQDYPPDILITNYSMLNIMLLRERDESVFAQTVHWLDADRSHLFTIVVDELHMYRGTPGTEVAYLVRNLLLRLNLLERPEQVRFLAASASLEKNRDEAFLEEFFGRPATSFAVISGEVEPPATQTLDLSDHASALAALSTESNPNDAHQVLVASSAGDAILNASAKDNGEPSAASFSSIGEKLFRRLDDAQRESALSGLLAGIAMAASDDLPRIRAHIFFRAIQGLWACSNPNCSEVTGDREGRTIGRLYDQPHYLCKCGGRILEFLYCQRCGDVFLGGYCTDDRTTPGAAWYLVPDVPDLERVPERAILGRSASNYLIYWPQRAELALERPTFARGVYQFEFRRSKLDPTTGRLRNGNADATGWSFHVEA